ncbi:3-carboxy-cis,cis-muconate cycloisomerase [Actinophytocola algeriensis]|uniref:3-carboxy-cis,cis-muconate cycloisomerase n=1 Tax=Actinophytocola algeriensis TaxID=1768010 RepID=A0A7W7VCK4_9PSEU|nr:3-carboxy-cis,cis-muconate cycloisomerase [Actinophytocola algeriensis]MBB4905221.1 3-carboxy-cis,cis-muconate cycloisomerase [Actinophytocola algeriensis]MBE1473094.1 3-carboxy-cis,cis-muconate cycloisomerase [Actinophytocola algeriensis]
MNADTGLLSPVWPGTGMDTLLADEAWVSAMLEFEVALARTQARLGVIPSSAVEPIEAAARAAIDVADLAVRARGSANPVVELVRELTAAVADPEAAEYVHRGSTSQDVFDSAAMLLAARALRATDADLIRVADALAGLADEHRHTPMAGRTLTQQAVPTTFGLKAAGWLTLVLDARDRLRQVLPTLPVQLGGAAGTLAAYLEYARAAGVPAEGHAAKLTEGVAAELGLRAPAAPWHTQRMPIVDLGWVVVAVTGALGKVAVDVLGATRTEVGEVVEPAGEKSGLSSAMPQKRNPVLATLLVSAARQAPGYAQMLGQAMLSEDERSAGGWQAEWQPLREALRLAGGAAHTAAELVSGLRVVPERMAANLSSGGGTIVAERLNVALAPVLGKATAKALLGRIAGQAAAGAGRFDDLLRNAPELASLGDRLPELLAPENYLGAADELIDCVLSRRLTS